MKDMNNQQGTRRTPLSEEQFAQASLALVQRWRHNFQAGRVSGLVTPGVAATAPAPSPSMAL